MVTLLTIVLLGCDIAGDEGKLQRLSDRSAAHEPGWHVYPGKSIQEAMEAAALQSDQATVYVHDGTYRPSEPGQALIWFNARHDGITLEAVGEVILTAANPKVAVESTESYPAIINHVVYFGDGVTRRTVFKGFKITGANHFLSEKMKGMSIEPSPRFPQKNLFFYSDGGGIKIFGRSYPTILDVEVYDNYASPCGGGVSVQHPQRATGESVSNRLEEHAVLFKNCIFRGNRARVTGSAVDLLWGSAAVLENCLFVGNISNTGTDFTVPDGSPTQYDSEHGCGALTVFRHSKVWVRRCTFVDNFNGVDDMSLANVYTDSIFWMNNAQGGISPGDRYELALRDGRGMRGCLIHGKIDDLQKTVDASQNVLGAPDPDFDSGYQPRAKPYENVGYRPVLK